MENMKSTTKLTVILFFIIILPNSAIIILHESKYPDTAYMFIFVYTVAIFIILIPLSKLILYIVINKNITDINKALNKSKEGDYSGNFLLPLQKPNESQIIKLKRNINWLIHAVSTREENLNIKLEKEKCSKIKFKEKSYVDSLTGVYNRRYFEEKFPCFTSTAINNESSITLIMIDCDKFKEINDTYGHQAGDSVLQTLGTILQEAVRSSEDHSFRYGGDEFGIVLLNTPTPRINNLAEEVRKNFFLKNQYKTTLSIGIAYYKKQAGGNITTSEDIKELADQALYKSKETGRNKITFYNA